MPASKKPRKAYRPKAVGRPIGPTMARELTERPHASLLALRAGAGTEEHAYLIVAHLTLARETATGERRERILAGLDALGEVKARADEGGAWQVIPSEVAIIGPAVCAADDEITSQRTDRVMATSARLYAELSA